MAFYELLLVPAAILVIFMLWQWGRRAYDRGRAESALAQATLEERLRHREEQLQEAARIQREESLVRERLGEENTRLRTYVAELEASIREQEKATREKMILLEEARQRLGEAFQALAAEALRLNSQTFVEQAKITLEKYQEAAAADLKMRQQAIDELVKPLRESLTRVDTSIAEMEKTRAGSYATLMEQIRTLGLAGQELQRETANLVKALKMPNVRGRWGELQLRRAVELAGLVEYCDFVEQESQVTEGGRSRPDMLIRLPGNLNVVVDAKAPLMAYLESLEAQEEEGRREKLRQHARQIQSHINMLGNKQYFSQCDPTPEFVVLFLPGESFFSAALAESPQLIEYGVERKVVLATPTTLIALLKLISYAWRQEQLTRNTEEVRMLGRQLHERLETMLDHFSQLGRCLDKAVESYNRAMGSLDSRVLVTARKFKELGAASGDDLATPELIEKITR